MYTTGEIILTTEDNAQLWNACVWDPSTGTALMTYKGEDSGGPHAACFLGNDYLLLSDTTKPVLNVWPVNSQFPISSVKFDCTGKVNAMAVTPDGFFCVTAVGKKLIVWQIASGTQLAVVDRHYLSVTCVTFTSDGSHFVSGGDDGQAFVWSLASLASHLSGEVFPEQTEPRYAFSHHRLPIQDIFVGHGGLRARMVTVSLDRSCRLYDLSCSLLIATVFVSYSLTAVTMSAAADRVFLGAANGKIFQFDLRSLSRTLEHHLTDGDKDAFIGHTSLITCLSISQTGLLLLSGSHDRRVILWDILGREIIRTIDHKGSVTNAFFAMATKQMFSEIFNPSLVLKGFKNMSDKRKGKLTFKVRTTKDDWHGYKTLIQGSEAVGGNIQVPADVAIEQMDESQLKQKLMEATQKNAELYKFAVEKVLSLCEEKKKQIRMKRWRLKGNQVSLRIPRFREKRRSSNITKLVKRRANSLLHTQSDLYCRLS